MERTLKATLIVVDRATVPLGAVNAALNAIRPAAAAAQSAVSAAMRGVDKATRATEQATARLGDGIRGAMRVAGGAVTTFAQKADHALGLVRAASATTRQALSRLSGPLQALGRAAGTAGGVGGLGIAGALGAVAKTGVDMQATLAGATSALTSLLGSSQKATAFVKALEQEAAQSLPTFKDLLPIATQLVQAYGPAGLGKVIPTIRAFGDATMVAAGGDTNRMELALLGFRQMLSRGVAGQEELNQIGENLGVGVTNMLKEAFGTADTEVLSSAGVTGAQVADAIVAGLRKRFGGAQSRGASSTLGGLTSGISDAFNSVSAKVSGGLYASLLRGLAGVQGLMKKLSDSVAGQRILASMEVVLSALGRAFEHLVAHGGKFIEWLGAITSRQGTIEFLTKSLAMVQTIVQSLLKSLGVDLAELAAPKRVISAFAQLQKAVEAGIRVFFAVGRVLKELVTAALSGFRALGDGISDVFAGMGRGAQRAAFALQFHFLQAFTVLGRHAERLLRLSPLPAHKGLAAGLKWALPGAERSMRAAQISLGSMDARDADADQARQARERLRDQQDPRRRMAPWERLAGAWERRWGDPAEEGFWSRYQVNQRAIHDALFAPAPADSTTAPKPKIGLPPAPQLYGSAPGMATVQTYGPVATPAGRGVSITLQFNGVQNVQDLKRLVEQVVEQQARQAFPTPSGY